ncbi:MAG: FliO/MopB family protein [Pirellulales bacterium]|nr:FliO/MopB family protein [Pirellulales bacterium]
MIRATYDASAERVSVGAARPNATSKNKLATGDNASQRVLPPKTSSHKTKGSSGGLTLLWTTGGALTLVLGLFLVIAWGLRRAAPKATLRLPGGVIEILGRVPLDNRQQMHLIQCGNKLLLVGATPEGARTLTEITEPVEVNRLVALCKQTPSDNAVTAFRHIFEQFRHRDNEYSALERTTSHGSLSPNNHVGVREDLNV